jgi:hypothetical protein
MCHAVITVKRKVRHLHSTTWAKFRTICNFVFQEGSKINSNPSQISSVIIIFQSSRLHKTTKMEAGNHFLLSEYKR